MEGCRPIFVGQDVAARPVRKARQDSIGGSGMERKSMVPPGPGRTNQHFIQSSNKLLFVEIGPMAIHRSRAATATHALAPNRWRADYTSSRESQ